MKCAGSSERRNREIEDNTIRTIRVEEDLKNLSKQVEQLQRITNDVTGLRIETAKLTDIVSEMRSSMSAMKDEIKALVTKPSHIWNNIVVSIATAIATAIAAAIVATIIK